MYFLPFIIFSNIKTQVKIKGHVYGDYNQGFKIHNLTVIFLYILFYLPEEILTDMLLICLTLPGNAFFSPLAPNLSKNSQKRRKAFTQFLVHPNSTFSSFSSAPHHLDLSPVSAGSLGSV